MNTRHLRKSLHVHWGEESGAARRVWRRTSRCTVWTISLRSGASFMRFYVRQNFYQDCSRRYPTFVDAVRDIDDALCMIFLFASLPSDSKVSPTLVENCARLAAEWQLYVMHTNSLRKVFLSIKGVYYQAEVFDQTITWLVPYQFTQSVRMLTIPNQPTLRLVSHRFPLTSTSE